MSEPQEWQLQDAKNRFSELVKRAQSAPQSVTVRGKPSAVIISFEEYYALTHPRQNLPELMRSAPRGFAELDTERPRDTGMREVAF